MIAPSEDNIKTAFISTDLNENELKNDSSKKQSEDFNIGLCAMDNETYNFELEDGMYMVNFAYTPCSKSGRYLLFKGILNGKGRFIGHHCIVRTNIEGTEASWQTYMEVRKRLRSIEEIFQGNNCPYTFRVPRSALAIMEKSALLTKLVSAIKGWREPRKEEWVLVELYRYPRVETPFTGDFFSAISHISLKLSEKQSYLTNFRGFRYNGDKICITSADISTNIAAFEKTHKCTQLCLMETPVNRLIPISIPANATFDNGLNYPASAPVLGDFHFWSREPIPMPPPYSKHPPPSAPPITFTLKRPLQHSLSFPENAFCNDFKSDRR